MYSAKPDRISIPPVEEVGKLADESKCSSASGNMCTERQRKILRKHAAVVTGGRRRRAWRACDRCSIKKTKCHGDYPCTRCTNDGTICLVTSRKKTRITQLPPEYAELLEITQHTLVATVQKLYRMVRSGDLWDHEEPELNARGLPVVHNIAEMLGCISPSEKLSFTTLEDADEFSELQPQTPVVVSDRDTGKSDKSLFENPGPPLHNWLHQSFSPRLEYSTPSRGHSQNLLAQVQQQQNGTAAAPLIQPRRPQLEGFLLDYEVLHAQSPTEESESAGRSPAVFGMRSTSFSNNLDIPAEFDEALPSSDDSDPVCDRSMERDNERLSGQADFAESSACHVWNKEQYSNPPALSSSFPSMDNTSFGAYLQASPQIINDDCWTTRSINSIDSLSWNSHVQSPAGLIQLDPLDSDVVFDFPQQMNNTMFGDYEMQDHR